jgi:hypothetical protein
LERIGLAKLGIVFRSSNTLLRELQRVVVKTNVKISKENRHVDVPQASRRPTGRVHIVKNYAESTILKTLSNTASTNFTR